MAGEKTILIVEDKAPIHGIIAHHLSTAGTRVLEAESGVLALKNLESEHVDLLFLDVMMPKLDEQDDVIRGRKLGAND